jgi:cytochrome P450
VKHRKMASPVPSTSAIVQQHAGRVSLIVALLSISLKTLLSSTYLSSTVVTSTITLVLLNWLRMEVSAALRRKNLPRGDLGLLLLGDLSHFFTNGVNLSLKNLEKYGETFTLNLMELVVSTGDPEYISWLWHAERKGQAVGFWPPTIQALVGPWALPVHSGKFHRTLRRMLEPAFTPKAVRDYLAAIDRVTSECLVKWSEGGSFHASSAFKMYALQMFFVASFGRVDEDLMKQFHDNFRVWLGGFLALFPLRIPGSKFDKAMKARENLLRITEELILRFKQDFPPESERAQKSLMGRVCYGKDEHGNCMSLDCLKDNVMTMVFAGHDTTNFSIGTALYHLAGIRPAIKEAIVEEAKAFKEPLDFDELKNAPLLNSFLAECWRLDPPIVAGWRRATKLLEHKHYKVQKGQLFQYNIAVATMNEKVYPDPTKFAISRFLPKDHPLMEDSRLHAEDVDPDGMNSNYPTFGGGTHACIGSHFAKLEMRVLLTRILQKYEVEIRNPKKVDFPIRGWTHEFKLLSRD